MFDKYCTVNPLLDQYFSARHGFFKLIELSFMSYGIVVSHRTLSRNIVAASCCPISPSLHFRITCSLFSSFWLSSNLSSPANRHLLFIEVVQINRGLLYVAL